MPESPRPDSHPGHEGRASCPGVCLRCGGWCSHTLGCWEGPAPPPPPLFIHVPVQGSSRHRGESHWGAPSPYLWTMEPCKGQERESKQGGSQREGMMNGWPNR